ncbi:MazG nucleotide pyrophosphohydrolase domain-containing protein [Leucobacter iarius]|uniref:Nucleoside triphosphate pyrophosphohydrolase n=1 Tax=Leucobacter iarius TaxID=333963 RepID=A0ABP4XQU5_9MICO
MSESGAEVFGTDGVEAAGATVPIPASDPVAAVRETVRRLVADGGCAWHGVQTHASLVPFLIEESAEVVDAIERELPADEVRGELGDVLYQVLFHAALAERDGEGYDLDAIASGLNEKLIARHPHVFGDRGYLSVEELHAEWERLKEDAAGERRGSRGALEGIPAGMPTLARAAKVVERLKRAGALDPAAERPNGRVRAEEAVNGAEAEAELGDALIDLVVRANALGVDPDRALRRAVDRLAARALPGE